AHLEPPSFGLLRGAAAPEKRESRGRALGARAARLSSSHTTFAVLAYRQISPVSLPVVQRHLHPALAPWTLRCRPAGLGADAQDRVLHDEPIWLGDDDLSPARRASPTLGTGQRSHEVAVGHGGKLPIFIGIVKIDSGAVEVGLR